MPAEAFADMWKTIKSGLPWNGLVKNRTKTGDHYWVNANVTPLIEAGNVVGYMSVRTKPGRAEVNAAEDLYRRMRNGETTHLRMVRGQMLYRGWRGTLQSLARMPAHLRLAISMLSILLVVLLWAGVDIAQAGVTPANAIGLTVSILMVAYQWYFLQSKLIAPIKEATAVARAMAGGDLSRKITNADDTEMGQLMQALRQMNVNLTSIIG
ncbi:MAG: HAMP domain-containing protein, partial [Burkholderiales bacterium]|nr:HAMP domain-containing protein [Burkholderiales bacterium]